MISKIIPFYPNTPDDTHCFQACLKMILKYFWKDKEFDWKDLDKITGKKEGLWTWPTLTFIWLIDNGFDVLDMETFDYKRFSKDRKDYLKEFYGKEAAEKQIKNSDIPYEIKNAKKLLKKFNPDKRIPAFDDVRILIEKEYIICCNINYYPLHNKNGYSGHFVLIKQIGKNYIVINDPGLPPYENYKISLDVFEKGWAYPNDKTKNILAVKLKT